MGDGATLRMIALNLGDRSANDVGVDGYFDNVVVTIDGDTTVYDFEPVPPNKDACKKGGYVEYVGLGIYGGGSRYEASANFGLTCDVTGNLMLDGGALMGLTDTAPDVIVYTGITFRF